MSERYIIKNRDLWDTEKNHMVFAELEFGHPEIPHYNANTVCRYLNVLDDKIKRLKLDKESFQDELLESQSNSHYCLLKARDDLDKLFSENKSLKYKNDCLQKQLDCTSKNYNELSKRYYNLQNSNKLRTDEPLSDSSLEKRLIDCEEYLKKMQSERDIYKNKYEKLSENIHEIYLNKIIDCLDEIENKTKNFPC